MFLSVFDAAVVGMMSNVAIDMDLHDGNAVCGPPIFHEKIRKLKDKCRLDEFGDPFRLDSAREYNNDFQEGDPFETYKRRMTI